MVLTCGPGVSAEGDARVAEARGSWAAGRVERAERGKKGAGPRCAALGPVREREGEGKGWAACGLGWADWFLVSFSFSFSISFSFSQTNSNLFEFNLNFEFKSYAFKQNKTMHQHECNNKFKPGENFNYL